MGMKKYQGFTIIELMAVVAILAIMLLIVIPTSTRMLNNNRMTSQANDFLAALSLARSEAVKRGSQVVVCVSSNQTSCTLGDFEDGWLMYEDSNADGTLTVGETTIQVGQALSGNATLRPTSGAGSIVFNRFGRAAAQDNFILCWKSDREGRDISITRTGRAEVDYHNTAEATGGCT